MPVPAVPAAWIPPRSQGLLVLLAFKLVSTSLPLHAFFHLVPLILATSRWFDQTSPHCPAKHRLQYPEARLSRLGILCHPPACFLEKLPQTSFKWLQSLQYVSIFSTTANRGVFRLLYGSCPAYQRRESEAGLKRVFLPQSAFSNRAGAVNYPVTSYRTFCFCHYWILDTSQACKGLYGNIWQSFNWYIDGCVLIAAYWKYTITFHRADVQVLHLRMNFATALTETTCPL